MLVDPSLDPRRPVAGTTINTDLVDVSGDGTLIAYVGTDLDNGGQTIYTIPPSGASFDDGQVVHAFGLAPGLDDTWVAVHLHITREARRVIYSTASPSWAWASRIYCLDLADGSTDLLFDAAEIGTDRIGTINRLVVNDERQEIYFSAALDGSVTFDRIYRMGIDGAGLQCVYNGRTIDRDAGDTYRTTESFDVSDGGALVVGATFNRAGDPADTATDIFTINLGAATQRTTHGLVDFDVPVRIAGPGSVVAYGKFDVDRRTRPASLLLSGNAETILADDLEFENIQPVRYGGLIFASFNRKPGFGDGTAYPTFFRPDGWTFLSSQFELLHGQFVGVTLSDDGRIVAGRRHLGGGQYQLYVLHIGNSLGVVNAPVVEAIQLNVDQTGDLIDIRAFVDDPQGLDDIASVKAIFLNRVETGDEFMWAPGDNPLGTTFLSADADTPGLYTGSVTINSSDTAAELGDFFRIRVEATDTRRNGGFADARLFPNNPTVDTTGDGVEEFDLDGDGVEGPAEFPFIPPAPLPIPCGDGSDYVRDDPSIVYRICSARLVRPGFPVGVTTAVATAMSGDGRFLWTVADLDAGGRKLYRTPTDGSSSPAEVSTGAVATPINDHGIWFLKSTTDGSSLVVVTSGNGIYRVDAGGGGVQISDEARPETLEVVGGSVYFSQGTGGSANDDPIKTVPLAAAGITPATTVFLSSNADFGAGAFGNRVANIKVADDGTIFAIVQSQALGFASEIFQINGGVTKLTNEGQTTDGSWIIDPGRIEGLGVNRAGTRVYYIVNQNDGDQLLTNDDIRVVTGGSSSTVFTDATLVYVARDDNVLISALTRQAGGNTGTAWLGSTDGSSRLLTSDNPSGGVLDSSGYYPIHNSLLSISDDGRRVAGNTNGGSAFVQHFGPNCDIVGRPAFGSIKIHVDRLERAITIRVPVSDPGALDLSLGGFFVWGEFEASIEAGRRGSDNPFFDERFSFVPDATATPGLFEDTFIIEEDSLLDDSFRIRLGLTNDDGATMSVDFRPIPITGEAEDIDGDGQGG
jgi:hypothetical protein